jgi:hypothetical protein
MSWQAAVPTLPGSISVQQGQRIGEISIKYTSQLMEQS